MEYAKLASDTLVPSIEAICKYGVSFEVDDGHVIVDFVLEMAVEGDTLTLSLPSHRRYDVKE